MNRTVLASALLCAATNSYAQALPVFELRSTVVTPQRFEAAQEKIAASISVISRDTIEHSTATSLPELLSREAGLKTRDSSGSPDKQIDLRGFGITGDRNTLILLDGQRLSEIELVTPQLSTIPLDAIERIEVVRGSGAVLYGGGATGGVINIITRAPRAGQREAYTALSYGSHNTTNIRAGGLLGTDAFSFSLHANRYDSDNYRANNDVSQENLEGDVRFATGNVNWKIKFGSDDQTLRLPGVRSEAQLSTDRRGTSTPNDFSTRTGKHASLAGNATWGRAELTADLSYRERKATALFSNFGFSSNTDVTVLAATPRVKINHTLFGLPNTAIAGLDWDDWDYESRNNFGGNTQATQKNQALFFQNQTSLSPATHVSWGARAHHVRSSLGTREQTRTPTAFELGLRHTWAPGLSTFAKTGRSFRIATVDENNFQTRLLEPQTSHDMEIGAEFQRGTAKLNLSIYRIRLNNEIYFQRLAGSFGSNINLPPTERRGLELDGSWRPVRDIALTANYSYTEAKFREGVFGSVDVTGNDIPLVPRHGANLGLTWSINSKTRISTDAQYVGQQRFDNDQANTFARKIPSYVLVNAGIFHDVNDWRLSLGVKNLLNEKYFSYGILASSTSFNAYPAAERTFFTSVEYRFKP